VKALQVMRVACLVAFALALVVLSVIDVDGDPMTPNLPSFVLCSSVDVDVERPIGLGDIPPEVPALARIRARIRRKLQRLAGSLSQEPYLHDLFIRGP
jgi:hypothetical protein